jgi:hypothetical protein
LGHGQPVADPTKEQFCAQVLQLVKSGRSRAADPDTERDALATAQLLMQQGEKTAELASHLLDILLALRKPVAGSKTAPARAARKLNAGRDAEARYARILAAIKKHPEIDLHSGAVHVIDQRLRKDGGKRIHQKTLYSDLEYLRGRDNLIIWTAQKLGIDPLKINLNTDDSVERVHNKLRSRRHMTPSMIAAVLGWWAELAQQRRLEHEAGVDYADTDDADIDHAE